MSQSGSTRCGEIDTKCWQTSQTLVLTAPFVGAAGAGLSTVLTVPLLLSAATRTNLHAWGSLL